MRSSCLVIVALCLLVVSTAVSGGQNDVALSGGDLWTTPADGKTFVDFFVDPIPADFFCEGSAPFEGTISFQGVPLVTAPEGILGKTDTILERLDDAVFDEDGVARTRLVFRALSLVSMEPVKTSCGQFDVHVSLDGSEQPVTTMTILKEREDGGHYLAHIRATVRLTFVPVGSQSPSAGFRSSGKDQPIQLLREVSFPPDNDHVWSTRPLSNVSLRSSEYARVDTDGDGSPDSWTPAPSNFAAGKVPTSLLRLQQTLIPLICHCDGGIRCTHGHCLAPDERVPDQP